MKKIIFGFLFMIVLFPLFAPPVMANGKKLQDLLDELNKLESQLKSINDDQTLTKNKINEIVNNIKNINNEIVDIEKTVVEIEKEIIELNEDIEKKDEEIKKLVNFLQLSTGENVYLEYALGATTLTDFIYRLAVVEQLSKYNDNLIDSMTDMIDKQEKRSKELAQKKVDLKKKGEKLSEEQFKLGDKITVLNEEALTKSEEIKDAKETIKNYQKLGCKPNDYISVCTNLTNDTSFSRPLTSGRISSDYSGRYHPITGVWHQHLALDIANSTGTPIYSSANGTVVHIGFSNCGGNYVTIQHIINGKHYASRYMHMHTVDVYVGQKVTRATVIGTVGGGESYDRCSTGPHLHFQIAEGIYAQDFYSFTLPHTVNPRSLINFPALYSWFYSRY